MSISQKDLKAVKIKEDFIHLNNVLLKSGVSYSKLRKVCLGKYSNIYHTIPWCVASILIISLSLGYQRHVFQQIVKYARGVRCVIPNNYFIWEATRPISDCKYCLDVESPIILYNASREEFRSYAYSSKPIIVKSAFFEWPAFKYFNFTYFKNLYDRTDGAYRSVDDECQFLHFKSDFISLRDVFSMDVARINNKPGTKSWYVGWGNCHSEILHQMRQYYPKPHFLPEDCEIPSKEYIFMGYDDGATMHLDFISRLMWQAQIKGSKTWVLKPSPECERVCRTITFLAEPGDAVLVDTRVWYHGTSILPGEFSLSIQSEYGNTMNKERLNALAVMSINKNLIHNISNFHENVVEHFIWQKDKRLEFEYKQ